MSVPIQCAGCGGRFKVKDELAGKKVKCPQCQATVEVPAVAEGSEAAAVAESPSGKTERSVPPVTKSGGPPSLPGRPKTKSATPEEIIAALKQAEIEPIKPRAGYLLAMAFVASLLVLLPMIYFAIVVATGYGVYWHAVNDQWMLQPEGRENGKAMMFRALMYGAPIVVGGVLIAFMLKPFLARQQGGSKPKSLKREQEPVLFAYIEALCDAVGAPHPARIDVTLDVNASASFRHPFFSFLDNSLVLTIGLPLVAGLSVGKFSGIIAHEFGHFSQFAAMRFGNVIERVTAWFSRVVFERDAWDEFLVTASGWDIRIAWVFWVSRMVVWLTRQILRGLMMVGVFVSRGLSRQMEFDADRYAARLVGSKTAREIMPSVERLAYAEGWAMSKLNEFFQDGQLVDNLPRLVAAQSRRFKPEAIEAMAKARETRKTAWYDTHPADAERIAQTDAEAAAGVFSVEAPAFVLFSDFDVVARTLTKQLYKRALGNRLDANAIRPVSELIARQDEEDRIDAVARRFAGIVLPTYRPVRLPRQEIRREDVSSEQLLAKLTQCRELMRQDPEKVVKSYRESMGWLAREYSVEVARAGLSAELSMKTFVPDGAKEPLASKSAVAKFEKQVAEAIEAEETRLTAFEKLLGHRLMLGLELAVRPETAERVASSLPAAGKLDALLAALLAVDECLGQVVDLQKGLCRLQFLLQQLGSGTPPDDLVNAILRESRTIARAIAPIQSRLEVVPYPFEHSHESVTLAGWMIESVPPEDSPFEVYKAVDAMTDNYHAVKRRLLGSLMDVAETAEIAHGLEQLSEFEIAEEAVAT